MAAIGDLDIQITFQDFTVARAGSGQEVKTWRDFPTVPTVWAKIEYLSGRGQGEDFEADQKTAVNRVTFTIRYRTDIVETMRIVYQSNNYDITHIAEVGRQRYLLISAEKKD